MSDRDLDITKFSYNSYRKLKKTLGEFDAVVECNEIAIREFMEQAKETDHKEYIKKLSSKHSIKVDDVDFLKFTSRIRQYYISSVSQQSEQFLKDFKEEWHLYFNDMEWSPIKTKKDKNSEKTKNTETFLENVIRNTSTPIPEDLMKVYEYYKLIRNYMSHTDRDINTINKCLKNIKSNNTKALSELPPFNNNINSLENINFDDFLRLTNIVKHIAYLICKHSKPSNTRISEILLDISKENNKKIYISLKKLKNNNVRYEKALGSFMFTSFGRFSSFDMKEIVKHLKCLLA